MGAASYRAALPGLALAVLQHLAVEAAPIAARGQPAELAAYLTADGEDKACRSFHSAWGYLAIVIPSSACLTPIAEQLAGRGLERLQLPYPLAAIHGAGARRALQLPDMAGVLPPLLRTLHALPLLGRELAQDASSGGSLTKRPSAVYSGGGLPG